MVESLESLGLTDQADQLVEELSGGQQQRTALARGLALRGIVLLADEVTSELDAQNRQRVLDLLRAEADRGAAVVFATHDPEAAAACDAELHLLDGCAELLRASPRREGCALRDAGSRAMVQDRVVAVTGGARGIGLAIATALAGAGARVAIGDFDADLAAQRAGEIGGVGPRPRRARRGLVRGVPGRGRFAARAALGAGQQRGRRDARQRSSPHRPRSTRCSST